MQNDISQHLLARLHSKVSLVRCLSTLPREDSAHLLSLNVKGCSAWMRATPSASPAFAFSPLQEVITMRRWLHIPVAPAAARHKRCGACGVPLSQYHMETCRAHGAATRLHNRVNWGVVHLNREVG